MPRGPRLAPRRRIEVDDPDGLGQPHAHTRALARDVAADLERGRGIHLYAHVVDEVVERGLEILVLASPDLAEAADERERRDVGEAELHAIGPVLRVGEEAEAEAVIVDRADRRHLR